MIYVSVIIVNWNGKKDTSECLKSIYKSTYENFEVVVVDNASKDCSVEFLMKRFPKAKIIAHDKNVGPVGGFNVGMKYAQGHLICLLGNDTIVDKDWLSELVKSIKKDKKLAIVGSRIKNIMGYGGKETCGEILNIFFQVINTKIPIKKTSFAPACAFVFRRDLFEKDPFIPEYFGNCEDVYLSILAKLKGYQVIMNPKSYIIHKGGVSVRKIPNIMDFHMEKNTILNFFILYRLSTILKLLPIFIMYHTADLVSSIFRKKFLHKINVYKWVIKNFKIISRYKKIIKNQRAISDRQLISTTLSYKLPIGGRIGKIFTELSKSYLYLVGIKTIEMRQNDRWSPN